MKIKSDVIFCLPFFLLATLLTFFVKDHPFFWDTIQLGSKQALFFYHTDFQTIILPEAIDSGHPPLFGLYLASIWTLFGKNLAVSHFAMLPFVWGILFFSFKIGKYLLHSTAAILLVVLLFADPVLASQSILISPDVVLACFFLMAIWAIFKKYKYWLALAFIPLALISSRGMMVVATLFFFDFLIIHENYKILTHLFSSKKKMEINWLSKENLRSTGRIIAPYLPAAFLAAAFLAYHYYKTGWIGYHANSPWAIWFERVDGVGFLKNCGVFAWRLLDFGRLFIWIVLISCFYTIWKRKTNLRNHFGMKQTGGLLLFCFLFLPITLLIYKGLSGHRYLLPLFLSLNIFCWFLIYTLFEKGNKRTLLLACCLFGLASGNFWIYPKTISQGWDSTLAHLPYYQLRAKMIDFIEQEQIPYESIGTVFPNIGSFEKIDLSAEQRGFVKRDFDENHFIFYSNIMNDFTDEELETLMHKWFVVNRLEQRGVEVILYENPNFAKRLK